MRRVDLVHVQGCPHAEAARMSLRQALSDTGMGWEKWDQDAPSTPADYRAYPSPTVLVDGVPVGGGEPGAGRTCRGGE